MVVGWADNQPTSFLTPFKEFATIVLGRRRPRLPASFLTPCEKIATWSVPVYLVSEEREQAGTHAVPVLGLTLYSHQL
jgi:hypothetical protein